MRYPNFFQIFGILSHHLLKPQAVRRLLFTFKNLPLTLFNSIHHWLVVERFNTHQTSEKYVSKMGTFPKFWGENTKYEEKKKHHRPDVLTAGGILGFTNNRSARVSPLGSSGSLERDDASNEALTGPSPISMAGILDD